MLQSSSSEKKLVKPLKSCFFGPNLHRKGVIMCHAQDGKKIFWQKYHQLSESFYFIKISYVLTELWIFFYIEWYFLSKKCHFQLKQLKLSFPAKTSLNPGSKKCILNPPVFFSGIAHFCLRGCDVLYFHNKTDSKNKTDLDRKTRL